MHGKNFSGSKDDFAQLTQHFQRTLNNPTLYETYRHDKLTYVHMAAHVGDTGALQYFKENQYDMNKPLANSGLTPMHFAAARAVEPLARLGGDLNIQDKQGNTPMHWAVEQGNLAKVQTLAGQGAKLLPKNRSGHTPLDAAVWKGSVPIMQELLNNGADARPALHLIHHHRPKLYPGVYQTLADHSLLANLVEGKEQDVIKHINAGATITDSTAELLKTGLTRQLKNAKLSMDDLAKANKYLGKLIKSTENPNQQNCLTKICSVLDEVAREEKARTEKLKERVEDITDKPKKSEPPKDKEEVGGPPKKEVQDKKPDPEKTSRLKNLSIMGKTKHQDFRSMVRPEATLEEVPLEKDRPAAKQENINNNNNNTHKNTEAAPQSHTSSSHPVRSDELYPPAMPLVYQTQPRAGSVAQSPYTTTALHSGSIGYQPHQVTTIYVSSNQGVNISVQYSQPQQQPVYGQPQSRQGQWGQYVQNMPQGQGPQGPGGRPW